MNQTIPRVEGGRLFQPEKEVDPILIGTPAWYDWLEQQSSFTFVDHALTFTAHKSVLSTRDSTGKHTASAKASSIASTSDARTR